LVLINLNSLLFFIFIFILFYFSVFILEVSVYEALVDLKFDNSTYDAFVNYIFKG
jgi:hypothetical protein